MSRAVGLLVLMALVASCAGPAVSTSPPSTEPGTSSVPNTTASVATTAGTSATDGSSTTSTSTTTTTTVSGTTTTTTVSGTTTTTSGPYRFDDPARLTPPDPLPGSEGAAGSGCAPGTDHLPDGVWYGYVEAIHAAAVDFDLACFYFGDIAWDKAAEVGEEAPNDVWIVNQNPRIRSVPVAADATVWSITGDPTAGHQPVAFSDWPVAPDTYVPCPGEFCGVWLYVNGGVATEIVEQFLP